MIERAQYYETQASPSSAGTNGDPGYDGTRTHRGRITEEGNPNPRLGKSSSGGSNLANGFERRPGVSESALSGFAGHAIKDLMGTG